MISWWVMRHDNEGQGSVDSDTLFTFSLNGRYLAYCWSQVWIFSYAFLFTTIVVFGLACPVVSFLDGAFSISYSYLRALLR